MNATEADLRANRLRLLNRIRATTLTVADFSKIEGVSVGGLDPGRIHGRFDVSNLSARQTTSDSRIRMMPMVPTFHASERTRNTPNA